MHATLVFSFPHEEKGGKDSERITPARATWQGFLLSEGPFISALPICGAILGPPTYSQTLPQARGSMPPRMGGITWGAAQHLGSGRECRGSGGRVPVQEFVP